MFISLNFGFIFTYEALKCRLSKFRLSSAEEKTKIIEFGRFEKERANRNGRCKPETQLV